MATYYSAELKLAKQLAQRANRIALKHYKTELRYTTKSDKSPVTIVDEMINQIVITAVTNRFPLDGEIRRGGAALWF